MSSKAALLDRIIFLASAYDERELAQILGVIEATLDIEGTNLPPPPALEPDALTPAQEKARKSQIVGGEIQAMIHAGQCTPFEGGGEYARRMLAEFPDDLSRFEMLAGAKAMHEATRGVLDELGELEALEQFAPTKRALQ